MTKTHTVNLDRLSFEEAVAETCRHVDDLIASAWERDMEWFAERAAVRGEQWRLDMIAHRREQLKLWRRGELEKMVSYLRAEYGHPSTAVN